MKYKIRKFQNPSSTLQYFGNLNQQAQDKNNSAESRVGRAFGITNNEEQGKKPASNYRTTKGGRTVANYVNDKHVDNPQ
jgi:hypothetical protein